VAVVVVVVVVVVVKCVTISPPTPPPPPPQDYPPLDMIDLSGHPAPTSNFGSVMSHTEAMVILLCMPPPAKYFGVTAYVTARIMTNDTDPATSDGRLFGHMALAEVRNTGGGMTELYRQRKRRRRKRRRRRDEAAGVIDERMEWMGDP